MINPQVRCSILRMTEYSEWNAVGKDRVADLAQGE